MFGQKLCPGCISGMYKLEKNLRMYLWENDKNNDNGSMLGGFNRTKSIYIQLWLLYKCFSLTKWVTLTWRRSPSNSIYPCSQARRRRVNFVRSVRPFSPGTFRPPKNFLLARWMSCGCFNDVHCSSVGAVSVKGNSLGGRKNLGVGLGPSLLRYDAADKEVKIGNTTQTTYSLLVPAPWYSTAPIKARNLRRMLSLVDCILSTSVM